MKILPGLNVKHKGKLALAEVPLFWPSANGPSSMQFELLLITFLQIT